MIYEDVPAMTREDVDSALRSGSADRMAIAILSIALHDRELEFAQSLCLRYCATKHSVVRGVAILGIGHLARRFGRVDQTKVEPIVQWALVDSDPYIRGQAEAAAGDIDHFTGWRVRRPSRRADA